MSAEAARPGSGLPMWGRAAVFFVVIATLGWLSNIGAGRRMVVEPITRLSVLATRHLVNSLGGDAEAAGTVLSGPDAMLDVKDGCNGVIAMILFTGAVLAYQASPAMKIIGLVAGIPAIWTVNLLRLATLYGVSVVAPSRLEFFHIYVGQTLIIICVAIMWYLWATWSLRRESRAAAGSGRTG